MGKNIFAERWTAIDRGHIGPNGEREIWICLGPYTSIASVRNGAADEEYGDEKAQEARAKLIAAAPEMLEALISAKGAIEAYIRRINSHITRQDEKIDVDLAVESLARLIAKARGES